LLHLICCIESLFQSSRAFLIAFVSTWPAFLAPQALKQIPGSPGGLHRQPSARGLMPCKNRDQCDRKRLKTRMYHGAGIREFWYVCMGVKAFYTTILISCYTRKRTDESEKTCIIRHFELVARTVKSMKSRNMTVSINKSFFGRFTSSRQH
jgi:hypothetical protein